MINVNDDINISSQHRRDCLSNTVVLEYFLFEIEVGYRCDWTSFASLLCDRPFQEHVDTKVNNNNSWQSVMEFLCL